jgi:hypothetical protein
MLDGQRCACIEVERLDQPDRRAGVAVADIGNLRVYENQRRPRIGSHLSRYASQWLVKGGDQKQADSYTRNFSTRADELGR